MKYDRGSYGGFAVRCGVPVKLTVGTPWTISYYELDRYQENGGANADTGIGPSGIYVFPTAENQIRIAIKTVETDGSYLAEEQFNIDMGYDVAGRFIPLYGAGYGKRTFRVCRQRSGCQNCLF